MNFSDSIFWNVDTQVDFVSPHGKLYVPGAELLRPIWKKITEFANRNSIIIVNTADWHNFNSAELSNNPDFVNFFPPHCMANSSGAEYIDETKPENPVIIDWETKNAYVMENINPQKHQNYVIRKDAFDVFKGNPFTEQIVKLLLPKTVFVYGVTTNVCVNDAVIGLAQKVNNVIVIEDAIKELPNIPLPFENWKKLGVKLLKYSEIENLFQN